MSNFQVNSHTHVPKELWIEICRYLCVLDLHSVRQKREECLFRRKWTLHYRVSGKAYPLYVSEIGGLPTFALPEPNMEQNVNLLEKVDNEITSFVARRNREIMMATCMERCQEACCCWVFPVGFIGLYVCHFGFGGWLFLGILEKFDERITHHQAIVFLLVLSFFVPFAAVNLMGDVLTHFLFETNLDSDDYDSGLRQMGLTIPYVLLSFLCFILCVCGWLPGVLFAFITIVVSYIKLFR